MQRQLISSGSKMEGPIGFSRAVRIGSLIAVAGTAAIRPDGTTDSPGDVYGQTCYCLGIAQKAIEEAGGQLSDVYRTRIMLRDMKHWEAAARAHGEFFSTIRPACTFVEVKGFIQADWLVEVEVDAKVGDD